MWEEATPKNETCSGRPSNMLNEDSIACMCNLLQKDRQYTVSGIHYKMATHFLNEDRHTIEYHILTETLKMSKYVQGRFCANYWKTIEHTA